MSEFVDIIPNAWASWFYDLFQLESHAGLNWKVIWGNVCSSPYSCRGANGKIRDSPRRRDPYLKIRDQDLEALTKSEPETLYQENRARDLILRKSEPVSKSIGSETWQWATRYSKNIRSISQEFQNVMPWRLIFDLKTRLVTPTYSKDCYRAF